jgi:putative addiction module CopG family antidote
LRRYLKDQVRAGRYRNEDEVVRDAIRQMQQREIEQFERLFGDYPGAPQGEPTTEDDAAIKAAINRHRATKINLTTDFTDSTDKKGRLFHPRNP